MRCALDSWTTGPRRPALAPDEVHVWQGTLDRPAARNPHALLCPEERRRAAAIAPPERRLPWVRSRAMLRELLGAYLHEDPRSLQFELASDGKPGLTGEAGRLRFSLSHSGPRTLLALAEGAEVGVDLQIRAPGRQLLSLAGRAFGAERAREFAALAPAERRRAFLAAWTLREAELKCLGVGLARAGGRAPDELWSAALPLGGDGAAALAAEEPPSALRCWRWAGAAEATHGLNRT